MLCSVFYRITLTKMQLNAKTQYDDTNFKDHWIKQSLKMCLGVVQFNNKMLVIFKDIIMTAKKLHQQKLI